MWWCVSVCRCGLGLGLSVRLCRVQGSGGGCAWVGSQPGNGMERGRKGGGGNSCGRCRWRTSAMDGRTARVSSLGTASRVCGGPGFGKLWLGRGRGRENCRRCTTQSQEKTSRFPVWPCFPAFRNHTRLPAHSKPTAAWSPSGAVWWLRGFGVRLVEIEPRGPVHTAGNPPHENVVHHHQSISIALPQRMGPWAGPCFFARGGANTGGRQKPR